MDTKESTKTKEDNKDDRLSQGTVIKKALGHYTVQVDGRSVLCAISNRLNKQLEYPTADPSSITPRVMAVRKIQQVDPIAVGDEVRYIDNGDGSGLIQEVLPRRSSFVRKSPVPMPGQHHFEQVLVANLDQVVAVMAAAQPRLSLNLLDRYLVSAESLELAAVVCLTKLDLAQEDTDLSATAEEYRRLGYRVLLTSALSGLGLEELKAALSGRLSVLIGKSGVGKTTLLNALQPGLGLRVQEVNQVTGKGKHTTTNVEMLPLDEGGAVVDTPGMREFGLWQVSGDDLALFFPEMRPLVGKCRFGLDCSHTHEPGCAIHQAVEQGRISAHRYESYKVMLEDIEG